MAVALAVVLYVGSRWLVEALDAGLLTRVDVLRVYVDAVGVRVNQTNRYIADDSVYLNDVVRTVYGDQMRSELLNLQALIDFFNAGIVSTVRSERLNKFHSFCRAMLCTSAAYAVMPFAFEHVASEHANNGQIFSTKSQIFRQKDLNLYVRY